MGAGVFEEFAAWLERINRLNPPAQGISAYNFGIIESENEYKVYLTGSRRYDPVDDAWARQEDYSPAGDRYFPLPKYFTDGKRLPDIQRDIISLLSQFLELPISEKSFVRKAHALTVGINGGDLIRVR
jgi:hypothetical protein